MKIDNILEFVRESNYDIEFRWINKTTMGYIHPARQKIYINIILSVVDTFLHEYLHEKYPDLDEDKIVEKTIALTRRMTKKQILKYEKRLPDYMVACVGGGSNSIGFFHIFFKTKVKFSNFILLFL